MKAKGKKVTGIEPSQQTILFVGNVIRQKGLVELIEAMGLLKKEEYQSYSIYNRTNT